MWPWHTTQHSGINRSTHLQPVRTQNLSKTHKLLMVCLHCPEPHPNSTPLAFPVPPPKKIAETNMAQGSYYLSLGFTKKAKPPKTIKKYPASLSEIRLNHFTNASIHQPSRNTTSNGLWNEDGVIGSDPHNFEKVSGKWRKKFATWRTSKQKMGQASSLTIKNTYISLASWRPRHYLNHTSISGAEGLEVEI